MKESKQSGGQLLPPWTYRNVPLFEAEKKQLFHCNWMLAAHISDFVKSGDYRTLDIGGERAVVILDKEGALQAFHNVCRHRGSRVVPHLAGNCGRTIACPFHGWSYELNGRLKNIPRQNEFSAIEKDQEGLIPIDLEVWHGFVFVRFQPGSKSVSDQLKPIENWVAPYRTSKMRPLVKSTSTEINYNWKLFHDVDNEGYHVPAAHPALYDLYGRDYKDFSADGVQISTGVIDDRVSRCWSVDRYKRLLPEFNHLSKKEQRLWLYIGIFPNLVIYLYPEKAGFYMSVPIDVNRTLIVEREFGLIDLRKQTKAVRYLSRRIDAATAIEDQNLVQWMHEALSSSVYPRNSFSRLESGVFDFHERLRGEIPVMALEEEPPFGNFTAVKSGM